MPGVCKVQEPWVLGFSPQGRVGLVLRKEAARDDPGFQQAQAPLAHPGPHVVLDEGLEHDTLTLSPGA